MILFLILKMILFVFGYDFICLVLYPTSERSPVDINFTSVFSSLNDLDFLSYRKHIKCYHFSIIPKFSNVNLFKIFIQRFVIRNIKPTFNINEFVKSELCREINKDLCSVCV